MSKESSSKVERLRDAILAQNTQDIVELAVFGDMDVDIVMSDGETPLTLAISTGNEFVVEALMVAEPDLNLTNAAGDTPFSASVDMGAAKMAMVFAEKGADVNAIPGGADKAVALIARSGDLQSLRLLADKGVKIEDKDALRGALSSGQNSEGQTFLMQAVDQGDSQMLEWLLKNGVNVNEKGAQGYTALTWAAGSSNIDISMMDYLLQNGADIEDVTEEGETPLSLALESSNTQAVDYLIDKGASIDDVAESAGGAISLFAKAGSLKGVKLLAGKGGAIAEEDKDMVRDALSSGRNNKGQTLLIQAIEQGDSQMLKWLVKNGADVNEKGAQGYTALTWAAGSSNIDISMMDYLLQNGADPDLPIEDGRTALLLASESKDLKAMECLVAGGADVNLESDAGITPVIRTILNKDLEGARLLFASGARSISEGRVAHLEADQRVVFANAKTAQDKIKPALDKEVAHEMGDPDAKRSSLEAITNALVFSGSRGLEEPVPDEVITGAISEAKRLDGIIQGCDDKTRDFIKSKIFLLDPSLASTNPKIWDVEKSGTEKVLVNLAVLYGEPVKGIEQLSGASSKRVQAFIRRIPDREGQLLPYSVGEDEAKVVSRDPVEALKKLVGDAKVAKGVLGFLQPGDIKLDASPKPTKKRPTSARGAAKPPAKRGRADGGMGGR